MRYSGYNHHALLLSSKNVLLTFLHRFLLFQERPELGRHYAFAWFSHCGVPPLVELEQERAREEREACGCEVDARCFHTERCQHEADNRRYE